MKSYNTNLGFSSEASIGLPSSRISRTSRKSNSYIPYTGNGLRGARLNLYPQDLLQLAYDSPTHYAAVSKKAFLTKGLGIDFSNLPSTLTKVLNNLNPYGDTINDILERNSQDYTHLAAVALKVTWGNDGYIKYIEHVSAANVRVGTVDDTGRVLDYVISNNWDNNLTNSLEKTYTIKAFNPTLFGKDSVPTNRGIPTPTDEQMENATQLIYLFDYKPNLTGIFEYYPIPDYIGAIDAIHTEIEIGISNKSILDNGLGAKYIMKFPNNLETEEQEKMLDYSLKQSFAGAKNNGGLITLFGSSANGSLPEVDLVNAADANTYLEVDKNCKQSIITAHGIPAILLEYNYGGGFNNRAEELTVAYDHFLNTKIKSYQDFILRIYNTLVSYLGWDNTLSIIPFTLNPNQTSESETSLIQ